MAVIEAIATTYLEADAASVTFSSIPATYEHLQLRVNARSDRVNYVDTIELNLNGDTGTNYSIHFMGGYNTSTTAFGGTGYTYMQIVHCVTTLGAPASEYGGLIIDILDYANTNKNTTVMDTAWASGLNVSASLRPLVTFTSNLWADTAAVNSIVLAPNVASNFTRGSEFTLYGLNSA